jgi:hypothetical protein
MSLFIEVYTQTTIWPPNAEDKLTHVVTFITVIQFCADFFCLAMILTRTWISSGSKKIRKAFRIAKLMSLSMSAGILAFLLTSSTYDVRTFVWQHITFIITVTSQITSFGCEKHLGTEYEFNRSRQLRSYIWLTNIIMLLFHSVSIPVMYVLTEPSLFWVFSGVKRQSRRFSDRISSSAKSKKKQRKSILAEKMGLRDSVLRIRKHRNCQVRSIFQRRRKRPNPKGHRRSAKD